MTKPKRPLLLTLSMWYFGMGIFIILICAYIGSTERVVDTNGALISNDYYIKNQLIWDMVGAIFCAFIFWATKKQKWWFQPIPLIIWTIFSVIIFLKKPDEWLSISLTFLFVAGFTIWYFYLKQNVREYFEALKLESQKSR